MAGAAAAAKIRKGNHLSEEHKRAISIALEGIPNKALRALNDEQVQFIRANLEIRTKDLAEKFKVSCQTINKVKKGKFAYRRIYEINY